MTPRRPGWLFRGLTPFLLFALIWHGFTLWTLLAMITGVVIAFGALGHAFSVFVAERTKARVFRHPHGTTVVVTGPYDALDGQLQGAGFVQVEHQ